MEAGVRHRIAGGEIVRSVGDKVIVAHQRTGVLRIETQGMGADLHMWIEPGNRIRGAFDLQAPNVGRAMQHLPLQVGQGDRIVIDDADFADACGCQILDQRRAKPARADCQHARGLELLLARPAHSVQHDVAGVAFDFFRRERVGKRHGGNLAAGAGPDERSAPCACRLPRRARLG